MNYYMVAVRNVITQETETVLVESESVTKAAIEFKETRIAPGSGWSVVSVWPATATDLENMTRLP